MRRPLFVIVLLVAMVVMVEGIRGWNPRRGRMEASLETDGDREEIDERDFGESDSVAKRSKDKNSDDHGGMPLFGAGSNGGRVLGPGSDEGDDEGNGSQQKNKMQGLLKRMLEMVLKHVQKMRGCPTSKGQPTMATPTSEMGNPSGPEGEKGMKPSPKVRLFL